MLLEKVIYSHYDFVLYTASCESDPEIYSFEVDWKCIPEAIWKIGAYLAEYLMSMPSLSELVSEETDSGNVREFVEGLNQPINGQRFKVIEFCQPDDSHAYAVVPEHMDVSYETIFSLTKPSEMCHNHED